MNFIDWISKFGFNEFKGNWVNPLNPNEFPTTKCLYLVDDPFYFISPLKNLNIPSDIVILENLESIVISSESIKGVEFLKGLKSLKSIQLYNLKIVPKELFEIPNLKSIHLNNCGIWELDSINDCRVEELELFDNNPDLREQIEYPIGISFLKSLKSLTVEYHYPKQSIPFSFNSIPQLVKLQIGLQNLFEQAGPNYLIEIIGIEANIAVLKNLERLNLNSVYVRDILTLLRGKNDLEELILNNCGLVEIPKETKLMTKLKDLDLRYNEINILPEWLSNTKCVKI